MSSNRLAPAGKRVASLVVCAVVVLAGGLAYAGDFDGSKNLICAPVEVSDCVAVDGCTRTVPSEVGAPAFIRIDFKQQAMVGPNRTSPIKVTEKNEAQLLLMGTELGYGWTVVLDQESGEMTVSMTNGAGSFVFFGSCTPLQ
jgi:hypothetical protein